MNNNYDNAIGLIYLIPILINLNIGLYTKESMKIKGAIVSGFALYGFATVMIFILIYGFYFIINSLLKQYNKFNSIFRTIILIILAPFFFLWMITLVYQNFSMQYFDFRILVLLYILLFFSQYMFVKRIREK